MKLKKSLFAGVFDSPTGEVSFAKLGRKTVFQAVKEIFAEQPGRPKPVIDNASPVPLKVMEATATAASNVKPQGAVPVESEVTQPSAAPAAVGSERERRYWYRDSGSGPT